MQRVMEEIDTNLERSLMLIGRTGGLSNKKIQGAYEALSGTTKSFSAIRKGAGTSCPLLLLSQPDR